MSAADTITKRAAGLFFILMIIVAGCLCNKSRSWFIAFISIHTWKSWQRQHVKTKYKYKQFHLANIIEYIINV